MSNKRKVFIRFVTMLLALATALSVIVLGGCKKKTPSETEETDTSVAEVTTEANSEEYQLPEADLDGFVFTVLSRDTDIFSREVIADEDSGDAISDAVFARNSWVEARYNCIIGINTVAEFSPNEANLTDTFNRLAMAGDSDVQLALGHMLYAGLESLQGTMLNWYDIPNIDFTNPWWHSSLIDTLTYNDKIYLTASDFCISSVDFTWVMIFNMQMAKDKNVDVYGLVEDGDWTLETFNEIVQDCYVSADSSGTVNIQNDTFGFTTHWNSAVTNWMFALEIPVSDFTEDGEYEVLINNDRMITATERIYDLFMGDGTLYLEDNTMTNTLGNGHDKAVTAKFSSGQTLFAAARILALENLRDSSIEYGIIPYPKYDTAQTSYHSHVDGRSSLMFVPKSLPTEMFEKVGILVEAISYASYRDVMPEIEKVCLMGRYSHDATAYKMLQLTLAGRSYAFSFVYNECSDVGPYWILCKLMRNHSTDISSTLKSSVGALKRDMNKILEKLK